MASRLRWREAPTISMETFFRAVEKMSATLNDLAAVALVLLMLLGVLEVSLRPFAQSLGGAFEISGFLGILIAAFALAHTARVKGHIAVDFLVQRLSLRKRLIMEVLLTLGGSIIFGGVALSGFSYSGDIFKANEVSMTIGMPVYPFAWGFAAGMLLMTFVLLTQTWQAVKRLLRR
ncbi:MAG: TRAP transporter small permease [Deltaproteobacteria bacterium]|nr:TRAP transporter small permease [Deltaproteobacteria bacterium]